MNKLYTKWKQCASGVLSQSFKLDSYRYVKMNIPSKTTNNGETEGKEINVQIV